jgi:CarD family transcriptional regulator
MYSVNDVVMYGVFGICRVTAVEKRDLTGKEQEYYVLKHLNSDNSICYVPVNNEKALNRMHSVCTRTEADELISHMSFAESIWIENETKRKEEYSRIVKGSDREELIKLIRTLYLRRRELTEEGKRLRISDENYFSIAEKMLFEEFAYALGIEPGEVAGYIEKHI